MVRGLCYNEKKVLFSTGSDSLIKCIDLEDFSIIKVLKGHYGEVHCVVFLFESLVASGGADRKVIIWNYEKGI